MASIEEILTSVLRVLKDLLRVQSKPDELIIGYKDGISTALDRLTEHSTPIRRAVTLKCRNMGTATWIGIGNEEEQAFRFTAVGDSIEVDFIDDLRKIYVVASSGSTSEIEWIGG